MHACHWRLRSLVSSRQITKVNAILVNCQIQNWKCYAGESPVEMRFVWCLWANKMETRFVCVSYVEGGQQNGIAAQVKALWKCYCR